MAMETSEDQNPCQMFPGLNDRSPGWVSEFVINSQSSRPRQLHRYCLQSSVHDECSESGIHLQMWSGMSGGSPDGIPGGFA